MTRRTHRGFLALAAIELIAVLVGIFGLAYGVYRAGANAKDNEWQVKEGKRMRAEADAQRDEWKRGDKASGELGAQLRDQAIAYEQLTEAFNVYKRRYPILARRKVGPPKPPASNASGAPTAPPDPEVQPGGSDVSVTAGAVWMWNSALSQRDVPVGACSAADPASLACALDSGIGLEQVWDNHALNARLCAEDRTRYQQLIEFNKGGKKK